MALQVNGQEFSGWDVLHWLPAALSLGLWRMGEVIEKLGPTRVAIAALFAFGLGGVVVGMTVGDRWRAFATVKANAEAVENLIPRVENIERQHSQHSIELGAVGSALDSVNKAHLREFDGLYGETYDIRLLICELGGKTLSECMNIHRRQDVDR